MSREDAAEFLGSYGRTEAGRLAPDSQELSPARADFVVFYRRMVRMKLPGWTIR